jgi:hypothetical protein
LAAALSATITVATAGSRKFYLHGSSGGPGSDSRS